VSVDLVRKTCLGFPKVTEQVQWGDKLVFKVGGRMFAVAALEPSAVWLSFKCSPEAFVELLERTDIIPAPYLARAKWVALETRDALSSTELTALLRYAYEIVAAKLPKRASGKKRSKSSPSRRPKAGTPKTRRKQN
jgi:predicted DNA-binding protein (MmcQ/YjbR family)